MSQNVIKFSANFCIKRNAANHRMNATWLIGALFKFLARISGSLLAEVLTPHPPSALCEPLGGLYD
jgi:hypothetical protein